MPEIGPAHNGEIKLGRALGLGGGIALVVGSIIGMGIYALVGPIAANSGKAMWLAFIIAMIISAIGVIPIIQAASAVPRAGVGYLITSRLASPLLGMLVSIWAIIGAACGTGIVCIGFAGAIASYWPWGIDKALEIKLLSLVFPVLFMGLYLFKLQLANWLEIVMVILKLLALGAFIVAGIFILTNPLQFSFTPPLGLTGMVMAIVLCYTTCMGFQVIAEMGEEMKNPKRNIPLSVIIGGLLVLVVYILVGGIFMSTVPYDYDAMMKMKSPLLDSARTFLPEGFVAFLGLGAAFAAITAINAAAMAMPREILAQGRDGILPSFFARVSPRTLTPIRAIGVYLLVLFLLLCLQFAGVDMDFYGVMAAIGILLMTVVGAFLVIRLPGRFPEAYNNAYIKVPRAWLIPIAIITAVTSLPFVVLVMLDYKNTWLILALLAGVTLVIILYYFLRVRWLKARGVNWRERTKTISLIDE